MKNFGYGKADLVCEYDQRVPATVLRLSGAEDESLLAQQGIQLAPGALMENARVVAGGDITATELFRSGRVAIQDEGSQLVAALVGKRQAHSRLLRRAGRQNRGAGQRGCPPAEIVAAELHPHRARLLRKLAPQPNVQVLTADALALPFGPDFDRVLADVPCSGTGTLARNPEIKWQLKPEDLHDLQTRQIAILRAAMRHVAPGGRLVYSTCSLEPEENEQVIAACLQGSLRLPHHSRATGTGAAAGIWRAGLEEYRSTGQRRFPAHSSRRSSMRWVLRRSYRKALTTEGHLLNLLHEIPNPRFLRVRCPYATSRMLNALFYRLRLIQSITLHSFVVAIGSLHRLLRSVSGFQKTTFVSFVVNSGSCPLW